MTWQPISTAPRNTAVLTFRSAGLMAVAEEIDHPADAGKNYQRRIWIVCDGCEIIDVTHWMPLPAEPEL